MTRPSLPSRWNRRSIRSAQRAVVIMALAALVLSQLLLGLGSGSAQAAAPLPPCHLGMEMPAMEPVLAGVHDHHAVAQAAGAQKTENQKTGGADLPHCPMMVGAVCLSLCATGPALPPVLLPPQPVTVYGPLPQAQLASRTDAPPLPPPRTL